MLQFPVEYTQHVGEHLLTAYPPKGGGRFRYWERLRPARSFSSVVEHVLGQDPDFSVRSFGNTLRIVTKEGEYGAWVGIEGIRDGGRAQHYVGAVFMDEFVVVLDTLVVIPTLFAEFAQLSEDFLRSVTLEQTARPRPVFYRAPAKWQALPSGIVANWYPLDFPRNRSNIVVMPARMTAQSLDELCHTLTQSLATDMEHDQSLVELISLPSGLVGRSVLLRGRSRKTRDPMLREVVALLGNQRAIVLRLETMSLEFAEAVRDTFRGVVDSVRPLSLPHERNMGRAFAEIPRVGKMWAD